MGHSFGLDHRDPFGDVLVILHHVGTGMTPAMTVRVMARPAGWSCPDQGSLSIRSDFVVVSGVRGLTEVPDVPTVRLFNRCSRFRSAS